MNFNYIPKLKDTISIPAVENTERLVKLDNSIFKIDIRKKDMVRITGKYIFVRKTVAKKLLQANKNLRKIYPNAKLLITYGYRSPEVQKKYFTSRLNEVNLDFPKKPQDKKIELAHSMSAHPKSAGHTCGAAVDLSICDEIKNTEWDMGSQVAEFGELAYTFCDQLTPKQKQNRLILQKLMVNQGFAPFLAEWWHFSYGDKEWAFYYKQPNAIYGVISPANAAGLL